MTSGATEVQSRSPFSAISRTIEPVARRWRILGTQLQQVATQRIDLRTCQGSLTDALCNHHMSRLQSTLAEFIRAALETAGLKPGLTEQLGLVMVLPCSLLLRTLAVTDLNQKAEPETSCIPGKERKDQPGLPWEYNSNVRKPIRGIVVSMKTLVQPQLFAVM